MNRKKILFISKHVVNDSLPMAGNQLFNYYLNRFATDVNFEVGFIVVAKDDVPYQEMAKKFTGKGARNFSIIIPKVLTLFTFIYYNSFLRLIFSMLRAKWYHLDPCYSFFYKKSIRKVVNSGWEPELIVCEWTEMIFLKEYIERLMPNAKTIATEHDVTFIKLERRYKDSLLLSKLFVRRFKSLEIKLLKRFDMVLVLSIDDKKRLLKNGLHEAKIMLLAPYYMRTDNVQGELKPLIIFYGAMNRLENQEAVEWFMVNVFMPFKLWENITFNIIGGGNNEAMIKKYSNQRGVTFSGFVKNPSDIFHTALCMVVPLTNGGGIKIKVIEAMSSSLTVITNKIGIEGLGARRGIDYLHSETPEQYRDAIFYLLEDYSRARIIGESGRHLVKQNFDYEKSYNAYKAEILSIIG